MIYTIAKRFDFSASHILEGLPEGHKCGRLHGHNYTVEVELTAKELDAHGFVLDYGALDTFKKYLDDVCDHRHLNDIVGWRQPTAEFLAEFLFRAASSLLLDVLDHAKVSAVKVYETPKTVAEYRP